MAHKIKTIDFPLSPPVESHRADVLIDLKLAAYPEPILGIKAQSKLYPLKPETVATYTLTFPTAPKIFKIDPLANIPKKIATTKIKFKPPAEIETITVRTAFDNMEGRVHRIVCKTPDKVKTFANPYLDHAPISREMLNKRFIPFPMLSDFMSELAKRNRTSYTNINFIGAFDPIPLHLAEKLTIDPVFGILKYYVRKEPKGERRFARMVYGRRRDTGDIVSAVFPVT